MRARDTRESLEFAYGDVLRNVVPILADLEIERVAAVGGLRFLKAGTGEVLAEWPQR
jgi:hypothetical protein